jgi:heme O synthase-like polyprenyltransferase
LYENREDYKKAGFVMISDQDPTGEKTAHKQMLYCNIFNTILPIAMCIPSVGMVHPAFLIPYFGYQI